MMLASGRFEPNGGTATLSIQRDDGLFCSRSEPLRPDADLSKGAALARAWGLIQLANRLAEKATGI